jgi:hypothetical protein
MRDSPAASLDGIQERLETISKNLARKPSRVHQPEIVNASQFKRKTLEQFLCGVVQLGVAVFHVEPLAGEFDRAGLPADSEQKQVTTIQGLHRDKRNRLSLCTSCERKHSAPDQRFGHWQFVCIL